MVTKEQYNEAMQIARQYMDQITEEIEKYSIDSKHHECIVELNSKLVECFNIDNSALEVRILNILSACDVYFVRDLMDKDKMMRVRLHNGFGTACLKALRQFMINHRIPIH